MKGADVRLEMEEARILYDDATQTAERLAAAIDRLGFQASVFSVTAAPRPTLYVDGLTDPKAVRKLERVLKALNGVHGVMVGPKDGEVFVDYDAQAVSAQDLLAALEAAGFKARQGSR